jgi:hypothetical protein
VTNEGGKKGALPVVPEHWQNFLLSLVFRMLLPLLPIAVELAMKGSVSEQSGTLAASMYSLALGISSRSRLFFGIAIALSIVYSVAFGIAITQQAKPGQHALWAIGAIFALHACERYNRHVCDRSPFLEFIREKV